jgi:5-methylcytosine-specific restriction endonuclease McrA
MQRYCATHGIVPMSGCPVCRAESNAKRNATPSKRAHRTPLHQRIRAYVLLRDGFACRNCGATNDLTVDYVIPLSRGGRQATHNARTLCRSCNSAKRDRDA